MTATSLNTVGVYHLCGVGLSWVLRTTIGQSKEYIKHQLGNNKDIGRPMPNKGRRSSEGARSRTSFLCSPPLAAGRHRQTAYLRYRTLGTFIEVHVVRAGAEDEAGCTKKYNAHQGERVGERERGVGKR